MRNFWRLALSATVTAAALVWAADWPMLSGGPQRNGWAKSERLIDKSNVSSLKLLYKFQAQNVSRGLNSLTSPIINGNLITYRGFKEMLMFGASSDKVFSVDADLDMPLWTSNLELRGENSRGQASTSLTCPGGLTAPVVMAGSSSGSMHFASEASRTPAAAGITRRHRSPYFPPLDQTLYPLRPTTLSQLAALYAVSSDGYLHVLNSSTGQDLLPSVKFLPPGARVTSLNIQENIIYATTGGNCDGFRNALFALDLLSNEKKVATFVPQGGCFSGMGGTAIGKDGTVYVQVSYAPGDALGHPHDTIVALTSKDLRVRGYFTPSEKETDRKLLGAPGITPMVFSSQGKEFVMAGGRDGRLYLLDSSSLGGSDHCTPLFATDVIAPVDKKYEGYGFRGAFSSWLDVDNGTRWFYAPIWGPPSKSAKLRRPEDMPLDGSIIAFKLAEERGHPVLQFAWLSRNIASPAPAVIANGLLFVLTTGESPRIAKQNGAPYSVSEFEQMSMAATLSALDAANGRELYSSGKAVSATASGGGLAVANSRAYFATRGNNVYCFGIPKGQPQLSQQ
ncbi:MAG: PQQ-like beta-propeller repeat protein [Acidobacteriota bacterium]|nr:PQQ-like beta-propeller repeat protein [Acidobacteriota bacterium]